jgi:hypothetical protein
MTNRNKRRYAMLLRVRDFGVANAQLYPTTSAANEAFAALSAEIEHLSALDTAERTATKASRAAKTAAAHAALGDILTRAGFSARVLAKSDPKLEARFEGPVPKDDLQLLELAREFAAGAAPWAEQFARHLIPLSALEGAIAEFEQAISQRGQGRDEWIKMRGEVDHAFARAMHAVAILDATVVNGLPPDSSLRPVWKQLRRLTVPPAAPTPAAPASTAASQVAPELTTNAAPTAGTTAEVLMTGGSA